MKVSEIVEDLTELTAFSKEEVQAHARSLREAGLLPQSRGRAHPDVTSEHVATLVVALGVSPSGRQAAHAVADHDETIALVEGIISDPNCNLKFASMNLETGSNSYSLNTPHPYPQHQRSEPPFLVPAARAPYGRGIERRAVIHEWLCRALGLLLRGEEFATAYNRALEIEHELLTNAHEANWSNLRPKEKDREREDKGDVSS